MDWTERGLMALIALILVALIAGVALSVREELRWEAFTRAHRCTVLRRELLPTEILWTCVSNGKGCTMVPISVTPQRVTYSCDGSQVARRED